MRAPSRPLIAVALLTASLLLMLACGDAPRTTTVRRVEDPWSFAQAAIAAGPMLVVVRGLPSPVPDVAIEDAVLAAVQQAVTWINSPRFTLLPQEAGQTDLRLVYIFNGRSSADPCDDAAPGGQSQQGGRVSLVAGLCDGTNMLVRVDGLLKRQNGTDDPRFVRLIRQATRDMLMPPPAPRP
jgi:hypothetical protein